MTHDVSPFIRYFAQTSAIFILYARQIEALLRKRGTGFLARPRGWTG